MVYGSGRNAQLVVLDEPGPGAALHRARPIRLREIGEAVGITERAAHRIVVELASAGYISVAHWAPQPLHDPGSPAGPDLPAREQKIGDLLAVLGGQLAETDT